MNLISPSPGAKVALKHHYSVRPLMDSPESALFSAVHRIAGGSCWVVAQASLASFLRNHDPRGFQEISGQHVEILICRREDWMPMMGVEVEEVAHKSDEQKARDVLINKLFTTSGIPLLRVPLAEVGDAAALSGNLATAWQRRLIMIEAAHQHRTPAAMPA